MKVDKFRKMHLAVAELIDAWRIIPRLLVVGYSILLVKLTMWYINLEPYIMEECLKYTDNVSKCIVDAPTTSHSVIITALIGVAGGIFGFYAKSGKDWSKSFQLWNKRQITKEEQDSQKQDDV